MVRRIAIVIVLVVAIYGAFSLIPTKPKESVCFIPKTNGENTGITVSCGATESEINQALKDAGSDLVWIPSTQ